ncbi:ABC transporter permease [Treponema primitia]|uniref:ABC transporter permease n=1 Tax=Treponema primitia TaxID=88058 RepID=UPI0018E12B44|nr:ABC transporter permease [Treponema primitia]
MAIIFAISSPNFLSAFNIFNMSRTASHYIFLALAQSMALIVGGMNLSIGYIGSMSVVTLGLAMQNNLPPTVAVILAILVGITAGLINGTLITRLRLNSFVVTLSTSFVFQGLTVGISKGMPYNKIPTTYQWLGRGSLFSVIPYMLILALIILVITFIFFRQTVLGRRILATGGNEIAARMSAVNTDRTILVANCLSGISAAIAAIAVVSKDGSANPGVGADWMIYSFAVAVIGGTSLKGGIISPFGLIASAFLIVFIKNGLVMINANSYFEQVYLGIILLVSVSFTSIGALLSEYNKRRAYQKEKRNREETVK